MKPRRYGPFPYSPINERPQQRWPNGARIAVWLIPNIEFFALDEQVPAQWMWWYWNYVPHGLPIYATTWQYDENKNSKNKDDQHHSNSHHDDDVVVVDM